jgi:hypothetical protein
VTLPSLAQIGRHGVVTEPVWLCPVVEQLDIRLVTMDMVMRPKSNVPLHPFKRSSRLSIPVKDR